MTKKKTSTAKPAPQQASAPPEAPVPQQAPAPPEAPAEENGGLLSRLWLPVLVLGLVLFNVWLYFPVLRANKTSGRTAGAPTQPGQKPPPPPQGARSGRPGEPPPSPGMPPPPPPPGEIPPQGSKPPPGRGLGPVEAELGVIVLQSEPKFRLDDAQAKAVLAAVAEVRKPMQAEYAAIFDLHRALRSDQIAYLNTHNGPISDSRSRTISRAMTLLSARAAEGGGTLPASPVAEELHMALEDVAASPLRLEDDPSVKLDGAQAKVFLESFEHLKKVDELESKLSAEIQRVLRPEQIQFLADNRTRLERARHLTAIRLLMTSLEKGN